MTGPPDLTVVVVTHNRPELALLTLSSAKAAADGLDVQWLVVDSGSTDGTPDAIADAHPDVTLLRDGNIGFAAGNNRALKLARGRYVLLLNPDAEVAKGSLADLVRLLDGRPQVGLASVLQLDPDGTLQHSIRHDPSVSRALGEAVAAARWTPFRSWREEEVRAELYMREHAVDWVVGAFMIARAEALAQVGLLDERFFLYSEEIDWSYRFRQAGWEVRHVPGFAIVHRTGSIASRPDLSAQLSYAKLLFARKHYGRLRVAGIRVALALRHLLRAIAAALLRRRSDWRARGAADWHALRVIAGAAEPPFRVSSADGMATS